MKFRKFSRRRFLLAALLGTPLAVVADARWIEPTGSKCGGSASAKANRRIAWSISPISITKGNRDVVKAS